MLPSGAHRRPGRTALVVLQLIVFVTYLFGPTSALAEDPTFEPTPTESSTPEATPEATPEPTPLPTEPPTPEPPAEPAVEPTQEPAVDPTPEATPEPSATPAGVPSPYLITFAPGTSDARQLEILSAAGATDVEAIPQLALRSILLDATSLGDQLATLRATADVVRVEADRIRDVEAAPTDSSYADQWSLPHIGWEELHGSVSIAGSATVAILDTGVDASHPDLDGVVLPGWSALAGVDPQTDPNGHGTWMAGIVAAETDNAFGVAGTAYAGVSVLPITVLGADGTGQDSDIIAGVVHAADADADVILTAFSNPGFSAALQAAIDYAWDSGSVLVAATGNDGVASATFPAGDRGVIGVTSTDATDALAASANHGPAAFMAAPGVDIQTTTSFDPATAQPGDEVVSISGTSAAAAAVAGAAALLLANEPQLSNGVVVSRLARTADPAGDPAGTGNGRLNLARAMADASLDELQPAGVAPLGDGGPFVGPYVAALTAAFFNGAATTQNTSAAAAASISVTKPAAAVPGDLMVAHVAVDGGTGITITAPVGWTLADDGTNTGRANNGTSVGHAIYYKFVGPSDPGPYIWTLSPSTRAVAGIVAYSGVDKSDPILSVGPAGTGATTSRLAPGAAVPSGAIGATQLAFYASDNDTTHSAPGSMTERFDVNQPGGGGSQPPTASGHDATLPSPFVGITAPDRTASGGAGAAYVAQQVILNGDQRATSAAIGSNSPLIIPRPPTLQLNDFMVAQISVESGSSTTITPPAGWTLIQRNNASSNVGLATYGKFAAAADLSTASYSFSRSTGKASGGIVAFSGVYRIDLGNPASSFTTAQIVAAAIDAVAADNSGGGSASISDPLQVVTEYPNAVLLHLVGIKGNRTVTPVGGTFERFEVKPTGDLPTSQVADVVQPAIGTSASYSASWAGGNEAWASQLAALRINRAPTATVDLSPTSPTTNQVLTATATKADADGDAAKLTFVWKNGTTVVKTTSGTMALTDTLDLSLAGNGDKGDVISVTVTPNDGMVNGANAVDSETVANSAPVVTLSGANSADEGDVLSFSFSTIDADVEVFTLDAQTCDGGSLSNDTFNAATGAGSFDCTWADNADDQNVSVTARRRHDGTTATA